MSEPLRVRDVGGCTCGKYTCAPDYTVDSSCRYHAAAAEQPWNHLIPWNCPTYWDGCNCEGGPYYEER